MTSEPYNPASEITDDIEEAINILRKALRKLSDIPDGKSRSGDITFKIDKNLLKTDKLLDDAVNNALKASYLVRRIQYDM